MGMYDSLYDKAGIEWQTKAFDRVLAKYRIGDRVSVKFVNFQVEIIGSEGHRRFADSYATIRDGILLSVNDARIESLPLLHYFGGLAEGTISAGLAKQAI